MIRVLARAMGLVAIVVALAGCSRLAAAQAVTAPADPNTYGHNSVNEAANASPASRRNAPLGESDGAPGRDGSPEGDEPQGDDK